MPGHYHSKILSIVFGMMTTTSLGDAGMVEGASGFCSGMVPGDEGQKYKIQEQIMLHNMATRVRRTDPR